MDSTPSPSLNRVNQTYTEATTWCCISKENVLVLIYSPYYIHLLKTCTDPSLGNTSIVPPGDTEFLKKILTPSKITLPLHRFIKKFLKIFQPHVNSIARPPSSGNQPVCPLEVLRMLFVLATEHTLLRIFLNIWRQMLFPRDLHDDAP